MIRRLQHLAVALVLTGYVIAQPSLTNNNLDNLTPTAKDNLEALGVLTDDAGPDNAAVAAAIAEDPEAARIAAEVPFIYAEDYGVTYTTSDDTTATANATALASAIAASSSEKATLVIRGTVFVKGEVLVMGNGIRILGQGAEIIQKDVAENGLTLDPATANAYDVIIENIKISGQGSATHDAAGFYGQNGDQSYLTSDIRLVDCVIEDFRTGVDIAGIAKFRTENLSILGARVGQRWNHLQTALLTNTRIVQGDSHADSVCFEITGGNFFANKVIGGEFGGSGITRFLTMTSGIFVGESLNLEAFSSNQTVNLPGTGSKRFELRNSRVSVTYGAATDAIVSCEVSGSGGVPSIALDNLWGWSGTPRTLEIYGTYSTGPGAYNIGTNGIVAVFAATQEGSAVITTRINPNVRNYTDVNSFPVSSVTPGQLIQYNNTLSNGDAQGTNLLLRRYNNRTSVNEWSSLVNDALMRSLGVSGRVASGNNVETDIQNVTLQAGLLSNNGESVEIKAFGSCAANANNKQFKFYFGGSQYFDFGSLPINGESWVLTVTIQRGSFAGGTGYMKLLGVLDYGSGKVIKTAETPSATIDSTASIATRTTVTTPSAASDAVSLAAKTIWLRTPQGF